MYLLVLIYKIIVLASVFCFKSTISLDISQRLCNKIVFVKRLTKRDGGIWDEQTRHNHGYCEARRRVAGVCFKRHKWN